MPVKKSNHFENEIHDAVIASSTLWQRCSNIYDLALIVTHSGVFSQRM